MGCRFLLQGIFLTQERNPGLLHCRQILYCVSYQGSLYLLENWFIIKGYNSEQPDERDAKGKVCVGVGWGGGYGASKHFCMIRPSKMAVLLPSVYPLPDQGLLHLCPIYMTDLPVYLSHPPLQLVIVRT